MGDGEISLAFAFNPNEALLSVRSGELPPSVRSYVLRNGTISNVKFPRHTLQRESKGGGDGDGQLPALNRSTGQSQ